MEYPNMIGLCSCRREIGDEALARSANAYQACEIERACWLLEEYWPQARTFDQRMTAGMLLGTCAVHLGDLDVWRRGEAILADEPCANDEQLVLRETLYALLRLSIYDHESVPPWLRAGRIGRLPAPLYALGGYAYLKYLCVCFREEALLAAVEPLADHAARDGSRWMEQNTRLIAAVAYHYAGRDEEAAAHLAEALRIATDTGNLAAVAEYRPSMDSFFDKYASALDERSMDTVNKASKRIYSGYAALRNAILGAKVTTRLSARELEAARYACRGMTNAELAARMGIKAGSVGAILHSVYIKLDVSGRDELLRHIL